MAERDPRVDPRPGDVLRSYKGIEREVLFNTGLGVKYIYSGTTNQRGYAPLVPHWIRWAANATVVRRGEGRGEG